MPLQSTLKLFKWNAMNTPAVPLLFRFNGRKLLKANCLPRGLFHGGCGGVYICWKGESVGVSQDKQEACRVNSSSGYLHSCVKLGLHMVSVEQPGPDRCIVSCLELVNITLKYCDGHENGHFGQKAKFLKKMPKSQLT